MKLIHGDDVADKKGNKSGGVQISEEHSSTDNPFQLPQDAGSSQGHEPDPPSFSNNSDADLENDDKSTDGYEEAEPCSANDNAQALCTDEPKCEEQDCPPNQLQNKEAAWLFDAVWYGKHFNILN